MKPSRKNDLMSSRRRSDYSSKASPPLSNSSPSQIPDPVSNEISDLCEISDLLLFVSYFASRSKTISLAITFLMCVV